MTQFELIPNISSISTATIKSYSLPELVHEDDPATCIMNSFHTGDARRVSIDDNIEQAAQKLKTLNVHILLVMNADEKAIGIVTTDDIFGEKPIQLQQQSRISREEITMKMLMKPLDKLLTFTLEDVEHARVGNVIATLKHHKQHCALVISTDKETNNPRLQGVFNTPQINKQLHI